MAVSTGRATSTGRAACPSALGERENTEVWGCMHIAIVGVHALRPSPDANLHSSECMHRLVVLLSGQREGVWLRLQLYRPPQAVWRYSCTIQL